MMSYKRKKSGLEMSEYGGGQRAMIYIVCGPQVYVTISDMRYFLPPFVTLT